MAWYELTRGIVMPAHCDVYGHMNVRHYAAFFDDAGWHILGKAGVSLSGLHAEGLGSVVATLTIDFHHELKAGQLTVVTGAITRVGDKSFSYEMRLHESESMTHCATQKTVEVCFDTNARRSAAWPDAIRAKLLKAIDEWRGFGSRAGVGTGGGSGRGRRWGGLAGHGEADAGDRGRETASHSA